MITDQVGPGLSAGSVWVISRGRRALQPNGIVTRETYKDVTSPPGLVFALDHIIYLICSVNYSSRVYWTPWEIHFKCSVKQEKSYLASKLLQLQRRYEVCKKVGRKYKVWIFCKKLEEIQICQKQKEMALKLCSVGSRDITHWLDASVTWVGIT